MAILLPARRRSGGSPSAARWRTPSRSAAPASVTTARRSAKPCSRRSSLHRTGVTFTVDEYDETMRRLETPDGRVSLAIPHCLPNWRRSDATAAHGDADFPLVLSAGERRSSTANTIQRDPAWRKKDPHGALRVSFETPTGSASTDGDRARITTRAARRCHRRGQRHVAGRAHHAAQRVRPRPRRRRVTPSVWRPTSSRPGRGSRLVRGHAAPQARPRPAREGAGVRRTRFDEMAVSDRPRHRSDRRLVDAARDARGVLRAPQFDEFQSSLEIPRAVLTARLKRLCDEGMLSASSTSSRRALRVPTHR